MQVVMLIAAEPTGEFFIAPNGEQMCKFPWPQGIIHYMTVPEPYQAGVDEALYDRYPEYPRHGGHIPGPCCTALTCGFMFDMPGHKPATRLYL